MNRLQRLVKEAIENEYPWAEKYSFEATGINFYWNPTEHYDDDGAYQFTENELDVFVSFEIEYNGELLSRKAQLRSDEALTAMAQTMMREKI